MRIFISAGEPSGDLHGANLIQSLRRLRPDLEFLGFGGPRMEAAGCRLLFPLCRLAVMWFLRVLANAPVFLSLLSRADRLFRHRPPDAVVLIDYPGFHWWLARRAHFHGIPVFYFVPPQLWAWAGWRVGKMRRNVDHVLCSLPFEEAWYRERGVTAHYVGHPYFDELPGQEVDNAFLAEQGRRSGKVIALLPGSRTQEVERNLGTMLRAAARVHADQPDTRFLFACYKEAHRALVLRRLDAKKADGTLKSGVPSLFFAEGNSLPIEVHVGRTTEIIRLAHACIAVSGSVGLELLYHGKPSCVVYRVGSLGLQASRWLMTTRYISLVNLLAGEELFPEFLSDRCEAEAIAGHVQRWLADAPAYEGLCGKLAALRHRVAAAGACDRAARFVVKSIEPQRHRDTEKKMEKKDPLTREIIGAA